ncbi:MAG TPA: NifU family protein [Stellaceae bacterium]|nr:NifU family protein [Stellaceae bacterium]
MTMLDRRRLASEIDRVSRVIRSHGGGIELVEATEGGIVTVRYTGMCAGCELRPVTTLQVVEPTLKTVPGVTAVKTLGMRISAEAEARIRQESAAYPLHIPRRKQAEQTARRVR